jgi:hypothetical protein
LIGEVPEAAFVADVRPCYLLNVRPVEDLEAAKAAEKAQTPVELVTSLMIFLLVGLFYHQFSYIVPSLIVEIYFFH